MLYLFTSAFAVTGLAYILYTLIDDPANRGVFEIAVLLAFSVFTYLSLRGLFDRSVKIRLTNEFIELGDGTILDWSVVVRIRVERKFFNVNRGNGVERFYLKIETRYSGYVSGRESQKMYEITGLEFSPRKIEHLVQGYMSKYNLDKSA